MRTHSDGYFHTAPLHPLTPCPEARVFLFFSNRLGCFGSIVLSLAVTGILILLLSR